MRRTGKRSTTRKAAPATSPPAPADPRIDALIAALEAEPQLAAGAAAFAAGRAAAAGPRKFGANGLKVDGKLFALFTQGTLVVKLPRDRVAALVARGLGKPFDPGHGRLMKEWLTVTSPTLSWLDLAREAHAFVAKAASR